MFTFCHSIVCNARKLNWILHIVVVVRRVELKEHLIWLSVREFCGDYSIAYSNSTTIEGETLDELIVY